MGALIVCRHFASDQVAGTTIVTCHRHHDYDDYMYMIMILTAMIMYEVIKGNIENKADLSEMCSAFSCSVERQRTIPEDCLQAVMSIYLISMSLFILIYLIKMHCLQSMVST